MTSFFTRTERIIGPDAITRLAHASVALFGLGGVGGYTLEALTRAGVGALHLIDADVFDITNLNRQLLATQDAIGRRKTDVARERVLSIRPEIEITTYPVFYLPETADRFPFERVDLVIDCVDTVSAKLSLAEQCARRRIPFISCMGTGNKLLCEPFRITTIEETRGCPLARVMRRELRKRGIERVTVVYSEEPAQKKHDLCSSDENVPGSMPHVPGCAGLLVAEQAILSLIGERPRPIPVLSPAASHSTPNAISPDSKHVKKRMR